MEGDNRLKWPEHITIPHEVLRWMSISIITYRVVEALNDE